MPKMVVSDLGVKIILKLKEIQEIVQTQFFRDILCL